MKIGVLATGGHNSKPANYEPPSDQLRIGRDPMTIYPPTKICAPPLPHREDLDAGWREVEGERCECLYSNARCGNIDVAITGVIPFMVLWDKTRGPGKVRAAILAS